ncbi:MAG: hypothetical protein ABS934_11720 [Psychrobacillus sp.]
MTAIKKLLIAVTLIALFIVYVIYNWSQDPTEEDVLRNTKNWSSSVEEVYGIIQQDGEWLAFYRIPHSITVVARLKQNWMGTWKMINYSGERGVIASVQEYLSETDATIPWQASGYENGYMLLMSIENPDIDGLVITANGKTYENISFIELAGKRFVLLDVKGTWNSFSYQALSKDGEVIVAYPQ